MEKIVLSRPTYNRLSDGANLAQDLANKATSPRGITPAKPQHKHYMARLTIETTVANGGLTWQAEEVYLDAVGAVVAKVGGFLWTDDNPVFTLNAATALDVIMVSQAGRPAIDPDPAKRYWFGNPGGGGASDFRLDMKSNTLTINTPIANGADIVTDLGVLIKGNVTVIQRVFDTAQVYDEILYGYIDEEGYYCIDKSILGV